jgi:hypothetical protein
MRPGTVITAIIALVSSSVFGPPAHAQPNQRILDGSTVITCGVPTTLFNGAVPLNGFMVSARAPFVVNDHGLAAGSAAPQAGFFVAQADIGGVFITPPGYKPMGVVSVTCNGSAPTTLYIAARAW